MSSGVSMLATGSPQWGQSRSVMAGAAAGVLRGTGWRSVSLWCSRFQAALLHTGLQSVRREGAECYVALLRDWMAGILRWHRLTSSYDDRRHACDLAAMADTIRTWHIGCQSDQDTPIQEVEAFCPSDDGDD